MISVIIPAYKAVDFLEECIQSIVDQKIEKEILLGIDACVDTLKFSLSNKLINQNCKIFYFEQNVGTYLVLNSMLEHVDDKIVFFGADDIMFDGLLNEADDVLSNFDIIRWRFYNFTGSLENKIDSKQHAPGACGIHKNVLLKFNGYLPWRMSADWEFQLRAMNYKSTYFLSNNYFYRRIHNHNMTIKEDTGMKSAARKINIDYIQKATQDKHFPNPDRLYTAKNILISKPS